MINTSYIFAKKWACHAPHLAAVIGLAQQNKLSYKRIKQLATHGLPKMSRQKIADFDIQETELLADSQNLIGAKRQNGKPYAIRCISVEGTLLAKCDWFDKMMGEVESTQDIAEDIAEAIGDEDVDAIVLKINSGGGEVNGIESLTSLIANSPKPIVAYVEGLAASAAYWIASATKKIVMAEQASEVGSIGVVTLHINEQGFYAMMGEEVTPVVADGSEDKISPNRFAPLDEQGLANLKAELNPIRDLFVNTIKKYRTVKTEAFTGKLYLAQTAIELGLADVVGSLGLALKEAAKLVANTNFNSNTKMAEKNGEVGNDLIANTIAKLIAENESLKQKVASFEASQKAENDLVGKLEALANKVAELEATNQKQKDLLGKTPAVKATAKSVFTTEDLSENEDEDDNEDDKIVATSKSGIPVTKAAFADPFTQAALKNLLK